MKKHGQSDTSAPAAQPDQWPTPTVLDAPGSIFLSPVQFNLRPLPTAQNSTLFPLNLFLCSRVSCRLLSFLILASLFPSGCEHSASLARTTARTATILSGRDHQGSNIDLDRGRREGRDRLAHRVPLEQNGLYAIRQFSCEATPRAGCKQSQMSVY